MKKAESTRLTILKKAFELIYSHGYQTTSIDEIIAQTKVTKGAFFYHFKSKDEMGLAIINEIIKPAILSTYDNELNSVKDPSEALFRFTKKLLLESPELLIQYGCPVGNIIQEMTPWNKGFTEILAEIMGEWQHTIEAVITKGKKSGAIRKDVNARQVAVFLISGYWGVRNFGKVHNSPAPYSAYLKELKLYLNSLK